MAKTVVHIVSHSHWDREWYMPLEAHKMRLIELFKDLFWLFENDPDFKSFHLDGQTIVLDDYLEIYPEDRELLQKYIAEGKLIIGPFYILQDDFLISSEANNRNTLIGLQEAKKFGQALGLGYFPDTFGNAGQIPQMMRLSGMEWLAFGRGVKPIGFDNKVFDEEAFKSQYSEMYWKGSDGSKVKGILFANWYSNGNDIPVEEGKARLFWDKKIADAAKFASSRHLLLMNGCDHQPVQKNLSEAIKLAARLYPDIEFRHSSFPKYIEALEQELPNDLSQVKGELVSQETDGWYSLTNTASSRIYLKQAMTECSQLLEQVVEPLSVLEEICLGKGTYTKRNELRYAWKLLLQNAPHDSICGCSVDEVHQEMQSRLARVKQVAEFLRDESLQKLSSKFNVSGSQGQKIFTVFNTNLSKKTGLVRHVIEVSKLSFAEARPEEAYRQMSELELPAYVLKQLGKSPIEVQIKDLGANFRYQLPKQGFRQAYVAREIELSFALSLEALSWASFELIEVPRQAEENKVQLQIVESSEQGLITYKNKYYELEISDELKLIDLRSQRVYPNFLQFEDSGDIGNEYMYFQAQGSKPIIARLKSAKKLTANSSFTIIELEHEFQIPKSAASSLELEQRGLVEFMKRSSGRSTELLNMSIVTELRLFEDSPTIEFKSSFRNEAKDHRIRLLLNTQLSNSWHLAESIYEVIKRPNTASEVWQNPENSQRMRDFVSLTDGKSSLSLGARGLHEYEVLDSKVLALTIHRSVGELGDWGVFPTPEAQCLGEYTVHYAIELGSYEGRYETYKNLKGFVGDFSSITLEQPEGSLPASFSYSSFLALDQARLAFTTLKLGELSEEAVIRYYNMSDQALSLEQNYGRVLDLIERELPLTEPKDIRACEIRTHELLISEAQEHMQAFPKTRTEGETR